MKDIVRKAGVSVMTVSYVLNNTKNQTISEATRARVLEAGKGAAVRSQRGGKVPAHQPLGLHRSRCRAEHQPETLSAALEGIRSALESSGYDMLLTSGRAEDGGLPAYVGEFTRNRIDGVLYISHDGIPIPERGKELLAKWNIPAAALDADVGETGFPAVEFDDYHSASEHTAHLLEKNIRDFLYVRPDCDTVQERERA